MTLEKDLAAFLLLVMVVKLEMYRLPIRVERAAMVIMTTVDDESEKHETSRRNEKMKREHEPRNRLGGERQYHAGAGQANEFRWRAKRPIKIIYRIGHCW